jgi:alpha-tubulin suppressor-like RCC1 family protein
VAAALSFRQVSAGGGHTCGVTTAERGYCWGSNALGQIGDGTTTRRPTPVQVAGWLSFRLLSAGSSDTCAVNLFDRAFCWGANTRGQLGDGTTTQRLTPVRVVGGLRFRQVSASEIRHTCGVTTGNLSYCWGQNDNGQLGDGTLRNRARPTPVAGPM